MTIVGRSCVVLPVLQLAGVRPGPIEHESSNEFLVGDHPHLDLEPPLPLVAGPKIDDRELVTLEVAQIEGIKQLDFDNPFVGGGMPHGVQQVDEQLLVRLDAEQALEGEVDPRIDIERHESVSPSR